MKTIIIILLSVLTIFSCKENKIKTKKAANKTITTSNKKKVNKSKVGPTNTVKEAIERTKDYALNLNFDLNYIRKKGLPDKKYLAEYLGLFLKLKKAGVLTDAEIKSHLKPILTEINKKQFHNMAKVDDKLFKKNSMSYMRIMWLLDNLGYDISNFKKEYQLIAKRMDDHLKIRGEWQKAVFDKYYDYFKIKKPIAIKYAKKLKGPIAYQKSINFYNRTQGYILTHFIFAAYDYGNALTQNRFTPTDIDYLNRILPQIIEKFETKGNDDLVGELLTCMVLIQKTNTPTFKKSYARLLSRQNKDGSFGAYERNRSRLKDDIEFRAYLHTTLVAIEMFVEDEFRKK